MRITYTDFRDLKAQIRSMGVDSVSKLYRDHHVMGGSAMGARWVVFWATAERNRETVQRITANYDDEVLDAALAEIMGAVLAETDVYRANHGKDERR